MTASAAIERHLQRPAGRRARTLSGATVLATRSSVSLDTLNLLSQLLFLAVFAAAVARYLRTRSTLDRDLLLVFASLAGVFVLAIAVSLLGAAPPVVTAVATFVLFLQPYLMVRLARHFRRVDRLVDVVVLTAGAVALVVLTALGSGNDIAIFVAGAYLVPSELAAALFLAQASTDRIGLARARLRLAASATALLGVAVLVRVVGAWLAPGATPIAPELSLFSRIVSIAAALSYLVAFVPPRRIRDVILRSDAFDLLDQLGATPSDASPGLIWAGLARAARSVTGGQIAAVIGADPGRTVLAVDGSPPGHDGIDPWVADAIASTHLPAPAAVPSVSKTTTLTVPIAASDGAEPEAWAVISLVGTPLFVEDDLRLVAMLGAQAARSIAREREILAHQDTVAELAIAKTAADNEARFHALLEAQPTGLLAADAEGRIVYANVEAARVFGLVRTELLGRRIETLLPEDRRSVHVQHRRRYLEDPHPRQMGSGIELVASRADGSTFPVEVALSPVHFEGQTLVLAAVSDITGRKEAETLRDRFIDVLSHELRTPVTAIFGGGELLLTRRGRLDPQIEADIVADMVAESDRLQRLVENLVALARVERGTAIGGDQPVLLQRLLPTIISQEHATWPMTDFDVVVEPGLPAVRADDEHIGQVLRNLLSNAAKYGDGGRVEVSAAMGRDGGVAVRVCDRGPGLAADDQARLFELYYRSPSTSSRAPGAGIGLFVCDRIIRAMGGRMWALSRDGGGAEFGFELPIYEADRDDGPEQDSRGDAAAAPVEAAAAR